MANTQGIPPRPPGDPDTHFLCLTICGYRRPRMSEEAYRNHMTQVSGPMTKDLMAKYGVHRWIMIHNTTETRAMMAQLFDEHMVNLADYDCFSQVTFKSIEDYKRMREDLWYKEKIAGDHLNFADVKKSKMTIGWVTEFVRDGKVIGEGVGGVPKADAQEKNTSAHCVKVQAAAIISGSFLSGCMTSLSLMAVPVLLDTATSAPQLYRQWTRMYHYGHQVMPAIAVATFLLYTYTSVKIRKRTLRTGNPAVSWRTFATAGIVTLSLIPFTWFVMVPTNNELFRREELTRGGKQAASYIMDIAGAKELVQKWSCMHLARSLLPLTGAIIGAVSTFCNVFASGTANGARD